jgi:hypothetical protein
MPKVSCVCGYVHQRGEIPDVGWVAVLDREYERLVDAEVALAKERHRPTEEGDPHRATVATVTTRLYECPSCGMLAWCRGDGRMPEFFRPVREKE